MTPAEIKALRLRLLMTQAEFGTRIGVDRNTVTRWENGTRKPGGPACRLMRELTESEDRRKLK